MTPTTTTAVPLTSGNFGTLESIEKGYFWFEGRVHWAAQFLKASLGSQSSHGMNYLDLGCGTGGFTKKFAGFFPFKKVVLVDGHPWKLQSLPENWSFHQANLESPLPLEEKFALVTCMDVMEHLKDDAAFLKQIYEQMAPGGRFLLTVPAFQFFFSDWDKGWGHYRRYSPSGLRKLLVASGFKVERFSCFWSFAFPFALMRMLKKKSEGTEFPPVSPFLNKTLILLSKVEAFLSRFFPVPFGTSVILLARRPSGD